jgi:hypothetical protein
MFIVFSPLSATVWFFAQTGAPPLGLVVRTGFVGVPSPSDDFLFQFPGAAAAHLDPRDPVGLPPPRTPAGESAGRQPTGVAGEAPHLGRRGTISAPEALLRNLE